MYLSFLVCWRYFELTEYTSSKRTLLFQVSKHYVQINSHNTRIIKPFWNYFTNSLKCLLSCTSMSNVFFPSLCDSIVSLIFYNGLRSPYLYNRLYRQNRSTCQLNSTVTTAALYPGDMTFENIWLTRFWWNLS